MPIIRKDIKGFRDVYDGEFKALGSDIGSRFDPDALYTVKPDGRILLVDKKTVIVDHRYLYFEEADEEEE
ncbi:hypothetical protein [Olavius algarvensis spirochete endosymbiont]|uniref:hypothetical protein n=1 Tax=Olavius algarvensis spirochete endosymbiont TaxID=260710 RepID=UPI0011CE2153|nr:hypothetical protein [Olavius algarvensis spirochete endosymbiont]